MDATTPKAVLRRIVPMNFPDIVAGGADMTEPVMERADPKDLWVDETYQRNLSLRSVRQIRRMIENWDWRSFQPPLVVRTADGSLHVVDGQHTAIAAATHPNIDTIPILVSDAPEMRKRAQAFIGRNRDRIAVTPTQMHHAALVARDEEAVKIETVCNAAGVRVLKNPPGHGYYDVGDTLAVGCVKGLIKKFDTAGALTVLKACVRAKLAPIPVTGMLAIAEVLCVQQPPIDADVLQAILGEGYLDIEQKAHVEGAATRTPVWRALARILAKEARNYG